MPFVRQTSPRSIMNQPHVLGAAPMATGISESPHDERRAVRLVTDVMPDVSLLSGSPTLKRQCACILIGKVAPC